MLTKFASGEIANRFSSASLANSARSRLAIAAAPVSGESETRDTEEMTCLHTKRFHLRYAGTFQASRRPMVMRSFKIGVIHKRYSPSTAFSPERVIAGSAARTENSLIADASFTGKQKSAPVFGGGQVALVLSCCESLVGGLTAGWPLARDIASEGGATATAAPHHSTKQSPGVTLLLGPPNCFPSIPRALCCGECEHCLRCPGHCPWPRHACGRWESDAA